MLTFANGNRTKVHGVILNIRSRNFSNLILIMTTNGKTREFIDENFPFAPNPLETERDGGHTED